MRLPLPWLGPVFSLPAPPAADEMPESSLEGLRVLAAEDNATNQLVLKTVLHSLGVQPVVVENGRMAVEAWAREPWDLSLMDVQMPEMDGPTATGVIRARERAAPNDPESVPACFLRAAHRPDLTIAVSEKRRQEAGGIKEAEETEVV